MGRAPLGFPSSFAPRRYRRRTSRAGPGHRSTDLELRDHIRRSSNPVVHSFRATGVAPSIGEEIGGRGLVPARTMSATAAECLLRVTSQAIRKHFVTAESAPASHPSSWQSATPSSSVSAAEGHPRRASRDWRKGRRARRVGRDSLSFRHGHHERRAVASSEHEWMAIDAARFASTRQWARIA